MTERLLRGLARVPGVARLRLLAERAVTPNVRVELAATRAELDEIHRHLGSLLSAFASTNGTAQLATRRLAELGARLDRVEACLAEK